jgi:2,5-diketo-D-gluconate reductase B
MDAGGRALDLPSIGLGTMRLVGDVCEQVVGAALAEGYRHLDTARKYGNEQAVGAALARSQVAADEVLVVTKLAPDELSAEAVPRAAEDSLRALGLDVLPLLLIHWPNPRIPLAETLEAMAALRDRGLIAGLGVANFPTALVREAVRLVDGLVTDQVEYHPYLSQERLLASLRAEDVTLTAYCPLARQHLLEDPVVVAVAGSHGCTPAQVVLRWLVQQPGVVAIPGTSNPARLRENLAAAEGPHLSDEELARLAARACGERVVDPPHAPEWD